MREHVIASFYSAVIAGMLGGLLLGLNEFFFFDGLSGPAFALFFGSVSYAFLAFVFSFILLFILRPLFRVLHHHISLCLFAFVGFGAPFSILYPFALMPVHGVANHVGKSGLTQVQTSIIISAVGAISAISAWVSLKKAYRNHGN